MQRVTGWQPYNVNTTNVDEPNLETSRLGKDPGSKLDDAKYLSVAILNEAAFMTFIGNHEAT